MADTKRDADRKPGTGTRTKREIERKYDAAADSALPDLTGVGGVADVVGQGVTDLDAVYYDTPDERLAAASITLRRRTGGSDAGWHLKLPVAHGTRDEVHAPLTDDPSDDVPDALRDLVRAHVRGADLAPVVRLRSARDLHHLLGGDGAVLAEISVDGVLAERLGSGTGTVAWTEIEVELADGGDPALLDKVDKKLRKAGVRPSAASSKLARALAETADGGPGPASGDTARDKPGRPGTLQSADASAGGHVLAYCRKQRDALLEWDVAVRQDVPDSVHKMRVATRRLRSAFKSYRKVLDRTVTDPLGDELKWLAAELGVDRDREVLLDRLTAAVDDVPRTLLLGPARARLQVWGVAGRADARQLTLTVLDSERYLLLVDRLDTLLADPPLRKAAAAPATDVLPKVLLKDYGRLAARVGDALALAPGEERDLALHEARKAAKRARYAGEAAKPALGKAAARFAKRMKAVQTVLGEHQDSVVARETLRDLAVQAHAAGESAFVWGLLYGREEAAAAAGERELPEVWGRAARPKVRSALGG
ncbi:CYTH and CHAD domain-containing protein [Streptomyces silvensis]|uniref:Metal-binding protein n=1 Tax=Streptomyces silvensis TaxID=1765722 RepID=A0A0W7WVZ1_9ACTN|nr:CYTH and CHAD domain-containing protein [Streptomyces silvensis]KUF14735.1 metal-binding protein [Streptomyces silvensis]